MTKDEFLEKWRHELSGMILDAATSEHRGAALGLFAREIMKKVDRHLVAMHNDFTAVPIPPTKGKS